MMANQWVVAEASALSTLGVVDHCPPRVRPDRPPDPDLVRCARASIAHHAGPSRQIYRPGINPEKTYAVIGKPA